VALIKRESVMNVAFSQIASRESGNQYLPIWRIDFEINGKRHWRDVQAQDVYGAQHVLCRELRIPFRPL
jgi:hypothetical protein